ncbi:lamina-associated polypeptide 2, isoforms alpha/zeta-like isoform X2 [Xenopus laevis]|uniref:Lamina-associated polypeptide 2, isoforms alpha/zeta-like isoform X2 n=1 Tax=Xenopus laevis TaxID=8355 RepID=A0A8J1LQD3_XENLA|nr:lamina-associated polypeptide 2, isoforms alpha/zeta-like isoform X2 [Xenopus laevis]XP_041430930.1 lamina-associated polypeptide 2, isoforms alpha/zeta-like isoform X2 [Xenopus laevis]
MEINPQVPSSPENAATDIRSVPAPRKSLSKEKNRICVACDNTALKHSKLCERCTRRLAGDAAADTADVMRWIREAVIEGVTLATKRNNEDIMQDNGASSSRRGQMSAGWQSPTESAEDELEEEQLSSTFDMSLVEPLIKAVRAQLELPEKAEQQTSSSNPFKFLKRERSTFPLHEVIKEIILKEWEKTDAKFPIPPRVQKLYPFTAEEEIIWEKTPKVDAAVSRLSSKTLLPVEDVMSFLNPMDRKMESSLKKTYLALGATCRPALALTSVARAMQMWLQNVELALKEGVNRRDIIESLAELKLGTDFVTEASVDMVRSSSRAMALSIAARRALWLRAWNADKASKMNLCNLPFEGQMLFGTKLEDIIKKVTGGKGVFLPQERKGFKPTDFRTDRSSFRNKSNFSEQRNFRFARQPTQWRGGQSSLFKNQRGRGTEVKSTKRF